MFENSPYVICEQHKTQISLHIRAGVQTTKYVAGIYSDDHVTKTLSPVCKRNKYIK